MDKSANDAIDLLCWALIKTLTANQLNGIFSGIQNRHRKAQGRWTTNTTKEEAEMLEHFAKRLGELN